MIAVTQAQVATLAAWESSGWELSEPAQMGNGRISVISKGCQLVIDRKGQVAYVIDDEGRVQLRP